MSEDEFDKKTINFVETQKNKNISQKVKDFSRTSTAAKLSGKYYGTTGFIKKKFGEYINDSDLIKKGKKEELLGKVHFFVGVSRAIREETSTKLKNSSKETQEIFIKHGGRALNVANDLVKDLKKIWFK